MKQVLLLVFVVLVVFLVVCRHRIYVRDPLATVYRTEPRAPGIVAAVDPAKEVKQAGAQVYINSLNDVLVMTEDQPGTLIQNWSKMPGVPIELHCLHWMACLTMDDHAATLPVVWAGKGTYDPQVTMNNEQVTYIDGSGAAVRILLR